MSQTKPPAGPLAQALALVVGAILLVLGFMFSLVLLAVFVAVALMLGAWFFWKTRHLRKAMREAAAMRNPSADGDVIEGEAVIVEEYRVSEKPVLPDDTHKP
jgi:UPF0716 family protein affecting phage T7 exclusion